MTRIALVVALSGALLAPSAVLPDDLDRRLGEAIRVLVEIDKRAETARAEWQKTRNQDAFQEYMSASAEYDEAVRRHQLSKSDFWEARHRLLDYIHDSDDETVFELYMLARENKEKNRKLQARIDATKARTAELKARFAERAVSLTPPPEPPD